MNAIGYCDETVNVLTGCNLHFECREGCWARRRALMLAGNKKVKHRRRYEDFKLAYWPERLPLMTRGKGKVIALNFMGDMFGFGEWHRQECIDAVFFAAAKSDNTFLVLTKNPYGLVESLETLAKRVSPPISELLANVWFGVSVMRQADAAARLHFLACLRALGLRNLWVSVEPMLEPIDLRPWFDDLAWVVCGPATGPKHKPFEMWWAQHLMCDCAEAHMPFWLKGCGNNPNWQKRPEGMA